MPDTDRISPWIARLTSDTVAALLSPHKADAAHILEQARTLAPHVVHPWADHVSIGAMVPDPIHTQQRWTATATAQPSGQFLWSCSCRSLQPCRHVGALLLAWVSGNGVAWPSSQNGEIARLAQAIAGRPVAEIRGIMQARGLRLRGKAPATRDNLVSALLPALLDTTENATIVQKLSPGALQILTVMALLSDGLESVSRGVPAALHLLTASSLTEEKQALAQGETAMQELLQWGLIAPRDHPVPAGFGFEIPLAIRHTLPPLPCPIAPRAALTSQPHKQRIPSDIIEDICRLVAVHNMRTGGLQLRRRQPRSALEQTFAALKDWNNDIAEIERVLYSGDSERVQRTPQWRYPLSVIPLPHPLSDDTLSDCAAVGWADRDEVEFVYDLARDLGIFSVDDGQVSIQIEKLTALLIASPREQSAILYTAWSTSLRWNELMIWLRGQAASPAALTLKRLPAAPTLPSQRALMHHLAEGRGAILTLLGTCTPGVWYQWSDLDRMVRALAPYFLQPPSTFGPPRGLPIWALYSKDEQPIREQTDTVWARSTQQVLRALVLGPLWWLGFVDIAPASIPRAQESTVAARAATTAAIMAWRLTSAWADLHGGAITAHPHETAVTHSAPLSLTSAQNLVLRQRDALDLDPTPRTALLRSLLEIAQPVAAEKGALVFAPSPSHIANAAHLSLDASLAILASAVDGGLPHDMVEKVRQWHTGARSVSLHRAMTIIEVSDTTILDALLHLPTITAQRVYRFSPHVLAVAPESQDSVLSALKQLGYAPRVGASV